MIFVHVIEIKASIFWDGPTRLQAMAKNTQIGDKLDVPTEEHRSFEQNWQEVTSLPRPRGVTCRTEAQ